MIQYSNSDQSPSLSSPPILSPPSFAKTQQSTVDSNSRRKRKASFPRKNIRQESVNSRVKKAQENVKKIKNIDIGDAGWHEL